MIKVNDPLKRVIEIQAHGIGERVLGVYLRLRKGKVAKTREVLPEVFADFDANGAVLGIEFVHPGRYTIDAMDNVAKKLDVPILRAIDVSKIPVNIQETVVV